MSDIDGVDVCDVIGRCDLRDSRVVHRCNLVECVARFHRIFHGRRRRCDGRGWNDEYLSDVNGVDVCDVIGGCDLRDGRVVHRRNLVECVARFHSVFHSRRRGWCDDRPWDDEHLSDID